ncbi:hypothetical protein, partial [Vibrio splendidus]|uniref:hypothetical protein n=1 Tax=Vibrio splendidus TaxID=29497 RepID=UPI001C004768
SVDRWGKTWCGAKQDSKRGRPETRGGWWGKRKTELARDTRKNKKAEGKAEKERRLTLWCNRGRVGKKKKQRGEKQRVMKEEGKYRRALSRRQKEKGGEKG